MSKCRSQIKQSGDGTQLQHSLSCQMPTPETSSLLWCTLSCFFTEVQFWTWEMVIVERFVKSFQWKLKCFSFRRFIILQWKNISLKNSQPVLLLSLPCKNVFEESLTVVKNIHAEGGQDCVPWAEWAYRILMHDSCSLPLVACAIILLHEVVQCTCLGQRTDTDQM